MASKRTVILAEHKAEQALIFESCFDQPTIILSLIKPVAQNRTYLELGKRGNGEVRTRFGSRRGLGTFFLHVHRRHLSGWSPTGSESTDVVRCRTRHSAPGHPTGHQRQAKEVGRKRKGNRSKNLEGPGSRGNNGRPSYWNLFQPKHRAKHRYGRYRGQSESKTSALRGFPVTRGGKTAGSDWMVRYQRQGRKEQWWEDEEDEEDISGSPRKFSGLQHAPRDGRRAGKQVSTRNSETPEKPSGARDAGVTNGCPYLCTASCRPSLMRCTLPANQQNLRPHIL
jgi:hypothetical protein